MHDRAVAALTRLAAAGLVPRLPDDFDELAELDRLARSIENPPASREFRALLRPVLHVGGIQLRRMSLGAALFHDDVLLQWELDELDHFLSTAYLMAEGRNEAAVWGEHSASRAAWIAHVHAWGRRILPLSVEELHEAVGEFLAVDRDLMAAARRPRPAGTIPDYGRIIEELSAVHGQPPRHWVWDEDQGTVKMLFEHSRDRRRRESGETATDPESHFAKTLHRFYLAEKELRFKIEQRAKGTT